MTPEPPVCVLTNASTWSSKPAKNVLTCVQSPSSAAVSFASSISRRPARPASLVAPPVAFGTLIPRSERSLSPAPASTSVMLPRRRESMLVSPASPCSWPRPAWNEEPGLVIGFSVSALRVVSTTALYASTKALTLSLIAVAVERRLGHGDGRGGAGHALERDPQAGDGALEHVRLRRRLGDAVDRVRRVQQRGAGRRVVGIGAQDAAAGDREVGVRAGRARGEDQAIGAVAVA